MRPSIALKETAWNRYSGLQLRLQSTWGKTAAVAQDAVKGSERLRQLCTQRSLVNVVTAPRLLCLCGRDARASAGPFYIRVSCPIGGSTVGKQTLRASYYSAMPTVRSQLL
jgi:hypothetical protein